MVEPDGRRGRINTANLQQNLPLRLNRAPRLEAAAETVALCADRVSLRASRRAGGVMKIGFVGLGIMGHPMALNLIKGGHELFVYGKRRLPADVREAGATVCDTLKEITERAEIVIMIVPDTPDV